MERATFRRDVVGTWSTTTRSSRVFERVAEGKRRENSKTSLQKDRWHDDQRMSIHGRRSSVSGAEPSFDTSDYRFSFSSPCFLSTVSICFPGRHHWNYQRNDGISFRADHRSFHVSLRTCISILLRAKNHRSKEYKPKRCWSMIVKVKAWKLDVSLFSNDFDGPCRQKENGIFGWYINFPFFLSFFFFFSFFSLVSF